MAILQPLIDIPAICFGHGIKHAVVSPGSRSAALTLAFARHQGIQVHICMDERSAAFIALGIAQQTHDTVVLICTSGSAAYNYAPAIAEAFFQQIPLLILTADRPKEWQHQYDGQTIYQSEIYGKHVKRSFELTADYGHSDAVWAINRIVNEAILVTGTAPHGPVHINVPIREPFYPAGDEVFSQSEHVRIIARTESQPTLSTATWHMLLDEWDAADRILIVGGQHQPDQELCQALVQISEEWNIPVVAESVTNLRGDAFIRHHDLFLPGAEKNTLVPDLLITFGLSLISKDLKLFLRTNPALRHWHVGQDAFLADPTQSLTQQIQVDPRHFFKNIYEKLDYQSFVENSEISEKSGFGAVWYKHELSARRKKQEILKELMSIVDLTTLDLLFDKLNGVFQIQVGNSMPIRYINCLGATSEFGLYCNRGTSGIDGCVSTAIGAAIANQVPTILIVGDVTFLYDRNGLLIRSLPNNLKIVVLNNAGGNIFRMIDGPANLPELGEYFETQHSFTAKRTCEDSGINYFELRNFEDLNCVLDDFLLSDKISLLEVFTDREENRRVWKQMRTLSI